MYLFRKSSGTTIPPHFFIQQYNNDIREYKRVSIVSVALSIDPLFPRRLDEWDIVFITEKTSFGIYLFDFMTDQQRSWAMYALVTSIFDASKTIRFLLKSYDFAEKDLVYVSVRGRRTSRYDGNNFQVYNRHPKVVSAFQNKHTLN